MQFTSSKKNNSTLITYFSLEQLKTDHQFSQNPITKPTKMHKNTNPSIDHMARLLPVANVYLSNNNRILLCNLIQVKNKLRKIMKSFCNLNSISYQLGKIRMKVRLKVIVVIIII